MVLPRCWALVLEMKRLVKLGVEQTDRITKRGKWLPSCEERKKTCCVYSPVRCIAETGLSCKKGEKRFGGLVKLNVRENFK